VHLVLYFFGGGHTIREADFRALKKIGKVANILPVVSLADTFTAGELWDYKNRIIQGALANKVQFFNINDSLTDIAPGDLPKIAKTLLTNDVSGPCPPFAIVNPQFSNDPHLHNTLSND